MDRAHSRFGFAASARRRKASACSGRSTGARRVVHLAAAARARVPAGRSTTMPRNSSGSEMPKRPDAGVIAEQVIERLKQIEDQVTHNQRLADELGRLRDVVNDLERAIVSRFSG